MPTHLSTAEGGNNVDRGDDIDGVIRLPLLDLLDRVVSLREKKKHDRRHRRRTVRRLLYMIQTLGVHSNSFGKS